MATRFWIKRLAAVNIPKTPGNVFSGYFIRQETTRINHFSTGFKQTEGTNQYGQDDRSTSSYVTDKAKEGVKKATETAINAGDNMKDTMEGAWKAAKETGQNISDAVAGDHDDDDDGRIQKDEVAVELKDVQQPVDTTEYRGVEDLHQQTDGETKSP